jgi:sulfhydrogenase subunit delta
VADRLPKLSVWKFSSCDGCQLSLLDCEDELLAIVGHIQIAYFLEATSAEVKGPYDVALVEGSVSTPEEAERIKEIRRQSSVLIAIGACATTGGIQALKNFADVGLFANYVYPHPEYLETLATSTPMSDHVQVDYELQGCPINKRQLLEALGALLAGRRPAVPTTAVCSECKAAGLPCVLVAHGTPCLGPVTSAGCGAICPSFHRGCYGCFGPKETANTASLVARWRELGSDDPALLRAFRAFTGNAPAFKEESVLHG